jgi:hypothetical protein
MMYGVWCPMYGVWCPMYGVYCTCHDGQCFPESHDATGDQSHSAVTMQVSPAASPSAMALVEARVRCGRGGGEVGGRGGGEVGGRGGGER